MALPSYNPNITLEEAIVQFDYATTNLALKYSLKAATEAVVASARLTGVIQNIEQISENQAMIYLRDTNACIGVLARARNNRHSSRFKRNTIDYYITLMRERSGRIRKKVKKWTEDIE